VESIKADGEARQRGLEVAARKVDQRVAVGRAWVQDGQRAQEEVDTRITRSHILHGPHLVPVSLTVSGELYPLPV
jgi:hypothetical protein